MTLTNVIISGNTAFSGGGLYGNKGTVTLLNCTDTGNTAGSHKRGQGRWYSRRRRHGGR